jgi:flagellar assembly factor FliW
MSVVEVNELQNEADIPIIKVVDGLPAFPWARHFTLVRWGGDDSPFSKFQSLDDPELAFLVVEPSVFFPDYEPEIDDHAVERLGLERSDQALLLVILTTGDRPEDTTANLLGPIVVHRETLEAVQVVLADSTHSTRVPIV